MADKNLSSGITEATTYSATDLLYAVIGGNSRRVQFSNLFKISRAKDLDLLTLTNSTNSVSSIFKYVTSASIGEARELVLQSSTAGINTLVLQNTAAAGYSALACRNDSGREVCAFGAGNSNASTFFLGRVYLESWTANVVNVLPPAFLFACDGAYGRTGTVDAGRLFQRATYDHMGMQFWKGVPWVDGSEQAKIAEFHEGGHFAVLNTTAPLAIDIPTSGIAFWFDNTAASPVLRFKSRDSAGSLYSGSLAISTSVSATVADAFTVADNASTITGGRTPDTGAAWASFGVGNWGVLSNKAYRSSGTAASYAYIDSTLTSPTVECDITLSSVRANAGIVINGVDATNYVYVALHRDSGNNKIQVFSVTSGAFTELTVFTGFTVTSLLSLNTTYNVRVGRSGNSIFLYLNGVLKGRWETGAHSTATKQGMWSYQGGTVDDDLGSRWDNFKVYS